MVDHRGLIATMFSTQNGLSLRFNRDQVRDAERSIATKVIAHIVGVVVDVGNLQVVALGDGVDDVDRSGSTGYSIGLILIARGYEDCAAIGRCGSGERVSIVGQWDGSGRPIGDVEDQHRRILLSDDDQLAAIGDEARVKGDEWALAEIDRSTGRKARKSWRIAGGVVVQD